MNQTSSSTSAPSTSLMPPTMVRMPRDRITESTLSVASREIRGFSTPRDLSSSKPISKDFEAAVINVDFPKLNDILISHGLKSPELQYIQGRAKLLNAKDKSDSDSLVDSLYTAAILFSHSSYLSAIPPMKDPKKIAETILNATNRFCEKRDLKSFETLRILAGIYPSKHTIACLTKAFNTVKDDLLLSRMMLRSFPLLQQQSPDVAQPSFPDADFISCLRSLAFESLSKILIDHDWEPSDLTLVGSYMKLLANERDRFGKDMQGLPCMSLDSVDEISNQLLVAGIENRRQSLLHIILLLPPFDSFSAETYAHNICQLAEEHLSKEPDNPFLKELVPLLKRKYAHPAGSNLSGRRPSLP